MKDQYRMARSESMEGRKNVFRSTKRVWALFLKKHLEIFLTLKDYKNSFMYARIFLFVVCVYSCLLYTSDAADE